MSTTNNITEENCRLLLAAYMDENSIGSSQIASAIGCSHSTLARIFAATSKPTIEFMKQVGILIEIGYERYRRLSSAARESISESIGAAGGGVVGFGAITAAISASGAVAGLSAAGIASGLSSIGAIVGGGMAAGVSVLAAIPLVAGAAGYAIIKGVRYFFSQRELNTVAIDPKWEKRT